MKIKTFVVVLFLNLFVIGCDQFPNTPVEKTRADTAKLAEENRRAEIQYRLERLKVMAEICKKTLEMPPEKGRGSSCHIE